MIFLRVVVAAVALMGVLVGAAQAEDTAGGADQRAMFAERMKDRMHDVDVNGDGVIEKSEFMAKASARFDKLDTNGDGRLTPDELRGLRGGAGAGGALTGEGGTPSSQP